MKSEIENLEGVNDGILEELRTVCEETTANCETVEKYFKQEYERIFNRTKDERIHFGEVRVAMFAIRSTSDTFLLESWESYPEVVDGEAILEKYVDELSKYLYDRFSEEGIGNGWCFDKEIIDSIFDKKLQEKLDDPTMPDINRLSKWKLEGNVERAFEDTVEGIVGEREMSTISSEMEGEAWDELRSRCLERDEYSCRKCHKRNTELHAHHIIPRHKNGADVLDNLATLCRDCHEEEHPWMKDD